MKMRTNALTDAALDWAVAEAQGNVRLQYDSREGLVISNILGWIPYRPSVAWQQGGPIIEREKISIDFHAGAGLGGEDVWIATLYERPYVSEETGPTALIAAMRCYVASKLGDDIDVPEELA